MTATLVNTSNMNSFLPILGKEKIEDDDLIVGVVDDETNTACGVLWAEAVSENDLEIRVLYVDEKFRDRGAGKELLDTFLEIAGEIGVENISCSYIYSEDCRYLYHLLDRAGFVDVSEDAGVYAVKLRDIYLDDRNILHPSIVIRAIKDLKEEEKHGINGIDISDCREDISVLAFRGDEVVGGMILRDFRNMLELSHLFANCENPGKVIYMLCQKSYRLMEELTDPGTWILVYADLREIFENYTVGSVVTYYDFIKFNIKL